MKMFIRAKLVLCIFVSGVIAAAQSNPNLRLGNPSNATTDATHADNYLLVKKQYVLSYNSSRGAPNWVSWTLKKSDIGKVARQNNFHVETSLPENGFQHVAPEDYVGSGFDRGHMCNSKDRTKTVKDNQETFSMANMQPQTADLNQRVWEKLEEDSRKLAQKGNTLFILAGCYGDIKHIGKTNTITVPKSCWKIADVEGPNSSLIVVDIPNKKGIGKDAWQKYATTLEDLEQKTGFHFTSIVQNP
jgi:endonuclease G, mitochondrial